MDIYERFLQDLAGNPLAAQWPQTQEAARQIAAPKPPHLRLPVLACQAAGGELQAALPVVNTIACMQVAIMLIDDLLDEDPRGQHHRLGVAAVANLASAFQSIGLEMLAASPAPPAARLAALECINRMMATTALGQHLDVQNPADEAAYWRVVETKSAPFFAAAMQAGALLGGALPQVAAKLGELGGLYGQMVQIHDDLQDCMAVPANPDWSSGRAPLPILFAQVVEHPERARFLELRPQTGDNQRLSEAQEILIRCGAVSYCVDQLLRRQRLARQALQSISLRKRDGLQRLLIEMVEPVNELFTSLGIDPAGLAPPV